MKISVILPNRNGEKYISICLDSILSQSHQTFEVVIVDAKSTDASHDIIAAYQKRDNRLRHIIDSSDQSLSDAINIGIRNATGNYAIWLGSDDLFKDSEVFSDFVKFITKYNTISDHSAVLCYGGYIVHWVKKNFYEQKPKTSLDYYMLPLTNSFMCGNVFFDPSFCTTKNITLSNSLKFSMDYDLWMQIYVNTKSRRQIVCMKDRYIYVFMMRSDNITGGNLNKSNIECRDVALRYAKKNLPKILMIHGLYYAQLMYQKTREIILY